MGSLAPDPEESVLCPVLSLKEYLKRTEPQCGKRPALFLSLNKKRGGVSANGISLWLRNIIRLAYEDASLDITLTGRTAHEVRALAASEAFKHNMSVKNVLEQCFWSSETVFVNHYLRDYGWRQGNRINFRFPFVALGHIVHL